MFLFGHRERWFYFNYMWLTPFLCNNFVPPTRYIYETISLVLYQMCGTYFNGVSLSKGCVDPDVCQTGCTDEACSICCGSSLCNQPWNNVLAEPQTCQPQLAVWCTSRLLFSLTQNETIDCR